MALSLNDLRPIDFTILIFIGIGIAFATLGGIYAIPWHRRQRSLTSGNLNILWPGRVALESLLVAWLAAQVLWLSTIWGATSVIFPSSITGWTGAGWMCRIYLTATLGILQPLCTLITLFMFAAANRKSYNRNLPPRRELWAAALATVAVAIGLLQAVTAWISLALQGIFDLQIETAPRSVLGVLLGTYWAGNTDECDGTQCTLCTFPAAAVILQCIWTMVLLGVLFSNAKQTTSTVLNKKLKARIKGFAIALGLLVCLGSVALALTIIQGPFSWINQAAWLAYFVTVFLIAILVSWELVIWPAHELRSVVRLMDEAMTEAGPPAEVLTKTKSTRMEEEQEHDYIRAGM